MRATIMGAGRMGQAIAWSMDKLGYDISLVDNNADNLFSRQYDFSKLTLIHSTSDTHAFLIDSDIVISAMPYHQNLPIAQSCISKGIKYCDLGGSVPVSAEINRLATASAKGVVMTDLGLAPGWVNILAEDMVSQNDGARNVSMMVGGLPETPKNYLKYNCTWSYDGLINEYKDNCEILVNGMQTVVSGMDGLITVPTALGQLEAFYTSGGASHTIGSMQQRGVDNCSYRTLRYPGHCEAVRFLIRECRLTDESLKGVFKQACPPAKDVVIIRVDVDGNIYEKIINSTSRFSAMQQGTAFPISSAADLIAKGDMVGSLGYQDLDYSLFESNLQKLFHEVKNEH